MVVDKIEDTPVRDRPLGFLCLPQQSPPFFTVPYIAPNLPSIQSAPLSQYEILEPRTLSPHLDAKLKDSDCEGPPSREKRALS